MAAPATTTWARCLRARGKAGSCRLLPLRQARAARRIGLPKLSCVRKVTDAAGRSLWLTGELEAAQEPRAVPVGAGTLTSGVLMVPHHGSKTESSDALPDPVAHVLPGKRKRHGHPAPPALARYIARGIPVVRCDRCGAGVWHPGQGGDNPTCERAVSARYWHHRAAGGGAELATR